MTHPNDQMTLTYQVHLIRSDTSEWLAIDIHDCTNWVLLTRNDTLKWLTMDIFRHFDANNHKKDHKLTYSVHLSHNAWWHTEMTYNWQTCTYGTKSFDALWLSTDISSQLVYDSIIYLPSPRSFKTLDLPLIYRVHLTQTPLRHSSSGRLFFVLLSMGSLHESFLSNLDIHI